ncbi:hypothetical protein RJT34_09607 [Clitoria ternatea]|uniref:Uncharacterized protein n=1 Tax=Clitoria ternatea TaxID=43366 RepID=A0AAN9K908_CLITE
MDLHGERIHHSASKMMSYYSSGISCRPCLVLCFPSLWTRLFCLILNLFGQEDLYIFKIGLGEAHGLSSHHKNY